jgi:glycosyltransferase involved in cell wall biosynthesis
MIKSANLTGSVSRNAGGLFESVRRLVQSLADGGMDIRVFGIEDEHTAADIGAWAPVPARAFHAIGPRQFGYSPAFRKALIEFSPDLVHTHGLWIFSSIATNQYCHPRGIPYVISPHGMLDPWAVRHSRWKKAIAHFFYEGAHLSDAFSLRALCEAEARAIRLLGLKNTIAVIPNGIDLPEIGKQKVENRNEFQLSTFSEGRKVLLFLSRIHPKKGLVNLLKAWSVVSKEPGAKGNAEEWVLAIAGWDQGGHEAELKRLATELGIPWADLLEHSTFNIQHPTSNGKAEKLKTETRKGENAPGQERKPDFSVSAFQRSSVLFLGPQFGGDKAACYRNCDGFILPSFSEGVPMVVLEAWAHGKPVLMTPECNLPAGFARGAAVRIETSVEDIARGLREFFGATEPARQQLGGNGLQLVREQFAWPVVAAEMGRLYEWALGGGNKPACITDF